MAYSSIDKPSSYFNTVLYTGNGGSNRGITGYGFAPDFIWHKSRSNSYNHYLFDKVRGVAKCLFSNSTSAEDTTSFTTSFNSFDSDGFTVSQITSVEMNQNSVTYANWGWKANGAGVSNNSGTITSTVSANTTSGFSIVSYTGTGSNATVGHGLGVAPKIVIVKQRTVAGNHWVMYNSVLPSANYFLYLDSTDAQQTATGFFNNTAPTSSVFTVGTDAQTNGSTNSLIAYCFAEIKGFSKFGSWTGDGATSTDGLFVYMGFKPKFFIWKRTDTAGFNWYMFDTARDTYNLSTKYILANSSNAEASGINIDFVSNGVKFRDYGSIINASGGKYIYMAFAENPFVSSKGIPCTAR